MRNDLIGFATAAEICGVKIKTVYYYHDLARKQDYPEGMFPRPHTVIDGHPAFSRSDVESWHANRPGPGNRTSGPGRRGNRNGRPRKTAVA